MYIAALTWYKYILGKLNGTYRRSQLKQQRRYQSNGQENIISTLELYVVFRQHMTKAGETFQATVDVSGSPIENQWDSGEYPR